MVAPGGWHGVLGRDTQGGGQGQSGPLLLSGPWFFLCTNLPFFKTLLKFLLTGNFLPAGNILNAFICKQALTVQNFLPRLFV